MASNLATDAARLEEEVEARYKGVCAGISDLRSRIDRVRQQLADGSESPEVDQLRKECAAEKTRKAVNKEHKGLYSALSKATKCGNKDVSTTPTSYVVGDLLNDALLKAAIANHLLREGRLPAARALIQAADIRVDKSRMAPFEQLHALVEPLRHGNRTPLLSWIHQHRDALGTEGRELEYALRREELLTLLDSIQGVPADERAAKLGVALQSMQEHLAPHADRFLSDIQRLSGLLVLAGPTGAGPAFRSELEAAKQWDAVPPPSCPPPGGHKSGGLVERAIRLVLSQHGVSPERPLVDAVAAGAAAAPTLNKLSRLMGGNFKSWHDGGELAVALNPGDEHAYRSVFICPVTRVAATKENPPVLLRCGHAICMEAMRSLPRRRGVFKCPTCPTECTDTHARVLVIE